jgi:hypothetical protein
MFVSTYIITSALQLRTLTKHHNQANNYTSHIYTFI